MSGSRCSHEKDPRYNEFLGKMRLLINEYKTALAPAYEEQSEMLPSEVEDPPTPAEDLVLDRMMVLVTWLDNEGDSWMTRISDPMPSFVWKGMMFEMIHD